MSVIRQLSAADAPSPGDALPHPERIARAMTKELNALTASIRTHVK